MPSSPPEDALRALLGEEIPSEVLPGISYRVISRVGEGAMSVAFYALRRAPEGETPVVIKILRPWFVERAGATAGLIVKKESVALGRLNERVPPTPFVVRLIDTGSFALERDGAEPLSLPWIVVEYVHGGAEGTTLGERVARSLTSTGSAFDPARAAHAIECLASGLMAVHEMGVIHRDVKPENVLCCGFDEDEIFKIADFGVARPTGVVGTFGGMVVGTLGYVAPELAMLDQRSIGPWSDVFSLGCVAYFILTGEDLFDVASPAAAIVAAVDPARRSIRDAKGLSPALRAREQACRSIDFAIACATSGKTEVRPQRADAVAAMIVPWLQGGPRRQSLVDRRLDHARGAPAVRAPDREDELTQLVGWSWTTQRPHTQGTVVRSVGWDGDGHCLAATSAGLSFWNGASWGPVAAPGLGDPGGLRFVRRVGAGRWLVGTDQGTFGTCTSEGIGDLHTLPARGLRFELMSGDLDDLAILVGAEAGGPPTLAALSSGRWLKPLPLPDVAAITSCARIEDARFLLGGRDRSGRGFAAVYAPLEWEVSPLRPSDDGAAPEVRAFLACAGLRHRALGLVTGAGGSVVWWRGGSVSHETIPGGGDVSAVGIDAVGRGWAAGAGRIWLYRAPAGDAPAARGRWEPIWVDPVATVPIVSLFPDLGVVIALTADGGIIEGRAETAGEEREPATQRFRAR